MKIFFCCGEVSMGKFVVSRKAVIKIDVAVCIELMVGLFMLMTMLFAECRLRLDCSTVVL
jgi:hypothetical protein